MSTIHSITDLADPRQVPFRTMRAQVGHLNDGVFVAEGPKVVHRLLESGHEVLSVLLPPEWRAEFEPLLAARPGTIDLFVADLPVLEQLTGFVLYQGVLYMGGENGILSAMDASNGQRLWPERVGGVFTASPIAGDGRHRA